MSIDSNGIESDSSSNVSLSQDGRYIAFSSHASNLVQNDTNRTSDVFVHDSYTKTTEMVSVDIDGDQFTSASWYPSISGNGRYVVFHCRFTSYLYDRKIKETIWAWKGENPVISEDGRFVAFESSYDPETLSSWGNPQGIYAYDIENESYQLVSVGLNGDIVKGDCLKPSISGDGHYITFESKADNLVLDDTNKGDDVFVYDTVTKITTRVSVNSNGEQGDNGPGGNQAKSFSSSISADGRYVAFASTAKNFIEETRANQIAEIYIRDLQSQTTTLVSKYIENKNGVVAGTDNSFFPNISSNGQYVTFTSINNFTFQKSLGGGEQVYLYDQENDTIQLISYRKPMSVVDTCGGNRSVVTNKGIVGFQSTDRRLLDEKTTTHYDIFLHMIDIPQITPAPPQTTSVSPQITTILNLLLLTP